MARIIRLLVEWAGSLQDLSLLRMLASSAVNVLLLSNNIRRNTVFEALILPSGVQVTLCGWRTRNLRPDEESSVGLLKKLLLKASRKIISKEPYKEELPCITNCPNPDVTVLKDALTQLAMSRGFAVTFPFTEAVTRKYCNKIIRMPYICGVEEAIVIGGMMLDWCENQREHAEPRARRS